MRPLDMLKIGQLMLDEGERKGKHIIDKQWVIDSMDSNINPNYDLYGYYWWRDSYYVKGTLYPAVFASGFAGQEIVIIKDLNLVVVKTASNYEMSSKISEMLKGFILPAFVE